LTRSSRHYLVQYVSRPSGTMHRDQWTVSVRPCSRRHHKLHADSLCVESLACPRHRPPCKQLPGQSSLPSYFTHPVLGGVSKMRPTEPNRCFPASYRTPRLLSTRPSSIQRAVQGSRLEALRPDPVIYPPSAACSFSANYSCLSKLQNGTSTSKQTVATSVWSLMDSNFITQKYYPQYAECGRLLTLLM